MDIKLRNLIILFIGIIFIIIGISMKNTNEISDRPIKITGTKSHNAIVGAGIGASSGGILAALIGGIGIVVGGTGFGLPAGTAIVALSSSIGAIIGGISGAAIGKSTITTTITNITPTYEMWQWLPILTIGILLLLLVFLEARISDTL